MLTYIILFAISVIVGQVIGHLNKKLPPVGLEEITYKEFFSTFFKDYKFDWIFSIIYFVIISCIYYFLGINAISIIYMLLAIAIILVFTIDYKYQIIPDELVIYTAVLGLIRILFDIPNWYMYIFGMLAGGLVFYLIGLLGKLIYKKDGMGFGDVKLMAALGLIFGLKDILVITLVSFFLGAIIGLLILIFRIKKKNEYIAFGPFIVLAVFILMFVASDTIINIYWILVGGLSEKITDLMYMIFNH